MRRSRSGGPGRGRRTWAAAAVLLLATAGTLGPGGTATAAPADDCATPTRTVTGSASGGTLDVAAGEVVLLAGGAQVGGVGSLPAGSTLCVAAGAVLHPAYVNNAAGTLYVAPGGTATMPSVAVNAGFLLDNAGTATFAGLALNGPSTVVNAAGATLTITGAFTPAAGEVVNDGTLALPGGATLDSGVQLLNTGTLTASGTTIVNGPFENAGTATLGGPLVVNGSGTLTNLCVLTASALTHDGTGSSNAGLVALAGGFTNQGTWRQSPTGALTATTLADDGTVSGFGRYVFSGATSVQGTFAGDSAVVPVFVDAGGAFPGSGAGLVDNVDLRTLTVPGPADYPAPGCVDPAAPAAADVRVDKTGPATVAPGGTVSYAITVSNAGPDPAAGVVVTDTLPGDLADVTASGGGVVAPPAVTWSLGTLAVGQVVTLTVTGTAPAAGDLVNVVSATATTADPDASNNDGSAGSETVTTEVTPSPPVVGPPVAEPLTREGFVDRPIVSTVVGTSPDPDLQLRYRAVTGPSSGSVVLLPNGLFAYLPAPGFVGTDTFTYLVCDNQVPTPLCSAPATVTLVVHPRAVDDATTTRVDQPVTVDVQANDPGGAVLAPVQVSGPSHGLVTLDPTTGSARYTPGPGYLGTDAFTYAACAPADPGDCATAEVTVLVVPDNDPPLAPPLRLETTVGTPVAGDPEVSDPDGDALTLTTVFDPVSGDATVSGATTTYTPPPGFAGRDAYQYTVCDDGIPVLCSTGVVTVLVDPVAADDSASTPAGTPVAIDVAANDLGTVLPPDVTVPPASGTVALVDGRLVYTPAPGFVGTDTFTYRVCAADVSPACDTAVVTVVVTAPVVPPGPGPEPGPAPGPDVPGSGAGPGAGAGAAARGAGRLPTTGAEAGPLAALALALLGAGTAAVARVRRPGR